jgi:hypothetical protein
VAALTICELIRDLRRTGVELSVEGDRLRCRAQNGVLTPGLRSVLVDRRDALFLISLAEALFDGELEHYTDRPRPV